MADTLQRVLFDGSLLDAVRHFDFGELDYQKEIVDWLIHDSAAAVDRGTRIWLYRNEAGDCIGYGSLGTTQWSYPGKKSPRSPIAVIPALGIRKEFQGQPKTAEKDQRYSSQILDDLIRSAAEIEPAVPALGLFVHPENAPAIRLYERFGFALFHTKANGLGNIKYPGYLRLLQRVELFGE